MLDTQRCLVGDLPILCAEESEGCEAIQLVARQRHVVIHKVCPRKTMVILAPVRLGEDGVKVYRPPLRKERGFRAASWSMDALVATVPALNERAS